MNPNDNIFIKANIQQLAPVPGDRQSEVKCGLLNILQVWTSKVLVSQIHQDFATLQLFGVREAAKYKKTLWW